MNNKEIRSKKNKPPLVEIIFAAAGLLLFITSAVFIAYKGIAENSKPPHIVIKADSILTVSGGYLVKLTVENKGDEVVSKITIAGELMDDEKTIENNTCEFDYIPSESNRKGGIYFTRNPESYKLVLKPLGYEEP